MAKGAIMKNKWIVTAVNEEENSHVHFEVEARDMEEALEEGESVIINNWGNYPLIRVEPLEHFVTELEHWLASRQ